MLASKQCLECLYNQIKNILDIFPQTNNDDILQEVRKNLKKLPKAPPPKIAVPIYKKLSTMSNQKDFYKQIKETSIQKAHDITQNLKQNLPLNNPYETLKESIKIAALGNIIDYGSQTHFSFENFSSAADFAIFDFEIFEKMLQKSKKILYFADNAGENLFDAILIETIYRQYPNIQIFYLTRDKPIINDITLEDITQNTLCHPLQKFCKILSSGMASPGFIYSDAPKKIQKMFNEADLIISKGMGNFECLENIKDSRLFLLFKIKCQVVADFLNIPIGKMIFKQNIY